MPGKRWHKGKGMSNAQVKTKNPNNNNERRKNCHARREGIARDVEVI